ncbi:MAG: hypothetical protein U0002_20090 [Thermoanaerobaculia bacterium]
MFLRRLVSETFFRALSLALLLAAGNVASSFALPSREEVCAAASTISLDSTYHAYSTELSDYTIHKVTLSATGMLEVDVASPGTSVSPTLTFLGTGCVSSAGLGTAYKVVNQTPAGVIVEILTTGTFYFEIAPEDSQEVLEGYKVRVSFEADRSSADETSSPSTDPTSTCGSSATGISSSSIDESWLGEISNGIDEWDRDVFGGVIDVPGVLRVRSSGTALKATVYASGDCDQGSKLAEGTLDSSSSEVAVVTHAGAHRVVIDPATNDSGSYTLSISFFALCADGESDDHGDNMLCAGPLSTSSSVSGQIDNTAGDDQDFFSFSLSSQETVVLASSGSLDSFGSLYDEAGRLLETDDNGGGSGHFRIERELTPGAYYVRVEGSGGAEGSYGLSMTIEPKP